MRPVLGSRYAALVRAKRIEAGRGAASLKVGRRRADDRLQRKQPARDDAFLWRDTNPEADVHAVFHPVPESVVELNIRLHIGIALAELFDDRSDHGHKHRLRSDDAQWSGDLILGDLRRLHRPL